MNQRLRGLHVAQVWEHGHQGDHVDCGGSVDIDIANPREEGDCFFHVPDSRQADNVALWRIRKG